GEELAESGGSAAQGKDTWWDAGRLGADGHDEGAAGLGDDHPGVASLEPAERAEFVPGDEQLAEGNGAPLNQLFERPPDRVRLVGEPDFDVLDVARDAGSDQPLLPRGPLRPLHHLLDASSDAGAPESLLDLLVQLADPRFGRVAPF